MTGEDHHHKIGEVLLPMTDELHLPQSLLKMVLENKSIAIEVLGQNTDNSLPCFHLGHNQVQHLSGTAQLEVTTIQVCLLMEWGPQVLLVFLTVILPPHMVPLPITPCLRHMDHQVMDPQDKDPPVMDHHMDLLLMEALHMGPHPQWCQWLLALHTM